MQNQENLLDVHGVAELLAVKPSTVYEWAETDRLPHYKLGNRLRFRPSEIERWLDGRRRGPAAPRRK
jgi:excisionase family DNA binding protein